MLETSENSLFWDEIHNSVCICVYVFVLYIYVLVETESLMFPFFKVLQKNKSPRKPYENYVVDKFKALLIKKT